MRPKTDKLSVKIDRLSNISYNFDSYNCISYNFNSYNFDSYNFSTHLIFKNFKFPKIFFSLKISENIFFLMISKFPKIFFSLKISKNIFFLKILKFRKIFFFSRFQNYQKYFFLKNTNNMLENAENRP